MIASDTVHNIKDTVQVTEQLSRQMRIHNAIRYLRFYKKNDTWVRLNMRQYCRISLNFIENIWISYSDFTWTPNIPNDLTCLTDIWKWVSFYMCQDFEYESIVYPRMHRILNMSDHVAENASIISEYVSIYFNAPQYAWTRLNIAECPRIFLKISKYTVLTMSEFSISLSS